jgi:hypothetical protein
MMMKKMKKNLRVTILKKRKRKMMKVEYVNFYQKAVKIFFIKGTQNSLKFSKGNKLVEFTGNKKI